MKIGKFHLVRKNHMVLAILTTASLVVSSFFYSRRVTLLQSAVDKAIQSKELSAFLGDTLLFLVFLILTIIFDFMASFVSAVNNVGMFKNLVGSQIKLMLNADMLELKKKNTGEIITRMFDDGWYITSLYSFTIPDFVATSFKVGLLGFAFYQLSPKILLIALLLSPFYSFPLSTSRRKIMEHQEEERLSFEKCVKFINETLSGAAVIKAFESKRFFNREFGRLSNLWLKTSNALFNVVTKTESLYPFLNGMLPIAVVALSSFLIAKKEITIGSAISFFYFISGFYSSISDIYSSVLDVMRSKIYKKRISDVMKLNTEKDGEKELRDFKQIRFQNVSFGYPDGREILTGLNIKIEAGDKIAIVASSGVGKSTLVSLLNRFLTPTKGKIFINNIPIEQYSLQSLRRNIVLVRSNDILFDTTVKNNITLFEDFPEEEVERVLKMCECDFVEELENGMDTVVGERGTKLSDGQRQRIVLARALIRKPQVLILDEVTSGVDSETEEKILEKILNEIETVIIVSHRLSTIKKASRIIVLNDGRVEAEGTHEELMKKSPLYREIVKSQLMR
ncbi:MULTISPECIES: ABC transporter ATP-binding protein [unclassified Thermotoga]|uniref:ABC transporter ATP-binding protein n=1 Tax=unclassified Thermotoga TaxID=2631113 RepID=UPI000280E786|nr:MULTISPECIES: ABC transporter ATP-binding protein [unclassified Thermotoga]AIY87030.1 ABC transporter [Thermotoga sp. 2812B]EJX25747.1 ABC transporter [Thermotoga sp. EMP]